LIPRVASASSPAAIVDSRRSGDPWIPTTSQEQPALAWEEPPKSLLPASSPEGPPLDVPPEELGPPEDPVDEEPLAIDPDDPLLPPFPLLEPPRLPLEDPLDDPLLEPPLDVPPELLALLPDEPPPPSAGAHEGGVNPGSAIWIWARTKLCSTSTR
jgi:hypothetical protein